MERKKKLEKLNFLQLIAVANKYNLSTDCKKAELIEAILKAENPVKPQKKTRPPRNEAKTKLKRLRVASGLSQADLAEYAGINVRTLQHYEQGCKPFDSARIDTILKVCIVLKCTLEDIIEDKEYLELIKEYKRLNA